MLDFVRTEWPVGLLAREKCLPGVLAVGSNFMTVKLLSAPFPGYRYHIIDWGLEGTMERFPVETPTV